MFNRITGKKEIWINMTLKRVKGVITNIDRLEILLNTSFYHKVESFDPPFSSLFKHSYRNELIIKALCLDCWGEQKSTKETTSTSESNLTQRLKLVSLGSNVSISCSTFLYFINVRLLTHMIFWQSPLNAWFITSNTFQFYKISTLNSPMTCYHIHGTAIHLFTTVRLGPRLAPSAHHRYSIVMTTWFNLQWYRAQFLAPWRFHQ